MKLGLKLRLSQRLVMGPQLQQSMRMLQLSGLDLQMEIRQALESNIMLESGEEDSPPEEPGDEKSLGGAEGASNAEETGDDKSPGGAEGASDAEETWDESAETDSQVTAEIPEDLPIDTVWEDIYSGAVWEGSRGGQAAIEQLWEQPRTLHTCLQEQVNQLGLDTTDQLIALIILDAIDENGYLNLELEELPGLLGNGAEIDRQRIQCVLDLIQGLEPTGVACRDLRECLQLQMKQMPSDTPGLQLAQCLVAKHLDRVAAKDYSGIQSRTECSQAELEWALGLIRSLDPLPGRKISTTGVQYVVPDVYVKKVKRRWQVELNPENIPQLRINSRYLAMLKGRREARLRDSIRTHLQEARWFMRSLQTRGEILLRIVGCIVQRQQAFLEHGEEAMRPLVLGDIAAKLQVHESTVSRATSGKYVHTPRGVYELKYFFSSQLEGADGREYSSVAVKAMIKRFIHAEPGAKPLSDGRISTLLTDRGIRVARRTVAKYRESLGIPPRHQRRLVVAKIQKEGETHAS